jgi:hypothetical protein
MTLAISHAEKNVAVLDAIREVKPPFSPESVVAEFSALLASYRISSVRAIGPACVSPDSIGSRQSGT